MSGSGLASDQFFAHLMGNQIALNSTNEDLSEQNGLLAKASMGNLDNLGEALELANTLAGIKVNQDQVINDLREEMTDLSDSHGLSFYVLAGIRGVTRELLSELRRSDPNNPLLEKKARDSVFDNIVNKTEADFKDHSWQDKDNETVKLRDDVFGGGVNADSGGPEKAQISSNTALRKEAGVTDSHVPEREKFLGLIATLAEQLKESNPDADILKDQSMVDVFDEYALHEMDKKTPSNS